MMRMEPTISGEHKTMLAIETLHAAVVMLVVSAATIIYIVTPTVVPSDLLGFVYGGAITYAGGRAAQSRAALMRKSDPQGIERNGD